MRSHGDLTGLIKFLARDDWKSSFEEVLGEHFGPAMQAFDLEYEAIGAALGGSGDMTLWGVAFEDFLGRQFEPDGRNFVDEYLRRRGWNESAPTKAYMRGLRNSIMSLYEASAIVPAQSFLARDLLRGGAPVLIRERTATRTLKEWDRIAARIVVQGQKRILAGGVLAFTFEGSEQLMAHLQEALAQSTSSGQQDSARQYRDQGALSHRQRQFGGTSRARDRHAARRPWRAGGRAADANPDRRADDGAAARPPALCLRCTARDPNQTGPCRARQAVPHPARAAGPDAWQSAPALRRANEVRTREACRLAETS